MKAALFATTSLLALALTQANAADLPGRGPAAAPAPVFASAPAFTWTGFYAGLNAGYGFGHFTKGGDALFGKANGGMIGGVLGYNQQFGAAVFGLEGDWDYTGVKGARSLPGPVLTYSRLTNLMTLRARAGYTFDNTLLFVAGGYAGGAIRSALTDAALPPGGQSFNSRNWSNGFAVGAGVEYAVSKNISAKAEYLYTGLAAKPIFAAPRLSDNGLSASQLRAGVNYHF